MIDRKELSDYEPSICSNDVLSTESNSDNWVFNLSILMIIINFSNKLLTVMVESRNENDDALQDLLGDLVF